MLTINDHGVEVPGHYILHFLTLPLTWVLKWGTVWACISTSIEAKHGQSWQFVFHHVNLEVLALTKHSFYAS